MKKINWQNFRITSTEIPWKFRGNSVEILRNTPEFPRNFREPPAFFCRISDDNDFTGDKTSHIIFLKAHKKTILKKLKLFLMRNWSHFY